MRSSGKDEKIFKLIKFRTMTCETDAQGKLLPDAQRMTKYGRILRSTSLDELPELINTLKGGRFPSLIGAALNPLQCQPGTLGAIFRSFSEQYGQS